MPADEFFDLDRERSPAQSAQPVRKACPQCGKTAIEVGDHTSLLASNPAQQQFVWWCACGYQEKSRTQVVTGKFRYDPLSMHPALLKRQWSLAQPR